MLYIRKKEHHGELEKRYLSIIVANSTIFDNLNNICTHVAYAINQYLTIHNEAQIRLIFDYPKIKSIECNTTKLFHEMSKILKPTKKSDTQTEANVVSLIDEALKHITTDIIFIEGTTSSYYSANFTQKINLFGQINLIVIRCCCNNPIIGLFDNAKYICNTADIQLFLDTIMYYEITPNMKYRDFFIKKTKSIIGSGKDMNIKFLNDIVVLTTKEHDNTNTILTEEQQLEYIEENINNEPSIYQLVDTVLLFHNTLTEEYDENHKENLKTYEYLNDLIKELHKQAREDGDNNKYRCASLIQYYLQNCQKKILKQSINLDLYKDSASLIVKYHTNTENKFKNNHLNKNYLANVTKNISILEEIKKKTEKIVSVYADKCDQLEKELEKTESLDFFMSSITLTNWLDEFKNGGTMGLLIKVATTDLGKLGICGSTVDISNITTTIMPTKDYIESAIIKFDAAGSIFGNLNNINVFTGDAIGSSNAIIPLYIAKEHWELSKIYMKPLLGIALAHDPLAYLPIHDSFMFAFLANMTRVTFTDPNNKSAKWLKTYFSVFRTCYAIAREKGYMSQYTTPLSLSGSSSNNEVGVIKMLLNFINIPLSRLNRRPFDNDVLLGQILCLGIDDKNLLNEVIEKMFEETLRIKISKQYDDEFIKYLSDKSNEEIYQELDLLIAYAETSVLFGLEIMINCYCMTNIMTDIYKGGLSHKQFISLIDDGYGVLPNELCENIKHKIINTECTIKQLYSIRGNDDAWKAITAKYLFDTICYPTNKKRKNAIENSSIADCKLADLHKLEYNKVVDDFIIKIKSNGITPESINWKKYRYDSEEFPQLGS